jgi:hypothetical protein
MVLVLGGRRSSAAVLVTMIDQAVTQNASKTATIAQSLKASANMLVSTPLKFFRGRAYLAVAGVYTGTYLVANWTMTYCEQQQLDEKMPKLAATSVTNIGLGVTKDSMFAIWFGAAGVGGGPFSFPLASWGCFIVRDVFTVGAGFVLPGIVSAELVKRRVFATQATADVVAQLCVPVACQVALTPFHLLALDIYNRPGQAAASRVGYIKSIFAESVAVRMARVMAVYGIAGVVNKKVRASLRDQDSSRNALSGRAAAPGPAIIAVAGMQR